MTSPRGKILVIRGGAIGDFVLTLPVLAALRQQFPETSLEVLAYPHIAQLAVAGGLVDGVKPIEGRGLASFFARAGRLDDTLAQYFSEFNIIISYLYDPDLIFQTNVCLCTAAQFIQGPHRPDESLDVHAAKTFLKPLEMLAIFDADPVPRLRLGATDGLNFPRFALHPGSGSERKNWAEERWGEVLQLLVDQTNWRFLLVGGEAEGDRLERLARQVPLERLDIARSLPLTSLALELQKCQLFAGHDSGISHLAAALGVPGLVLWGPSREAIWRPPNPQVSILRKASLAEISPLDVSAQLQQIFLRFAP